jgi:Cu(I)/Ag(I) efflux system membrane fusion protein
MTRGRISIVVGALLLAGVSFWVGVRWSGGTADGIARARDVYACPMHPQYRADHPGDCVSCGMRLEPVGEGPAAGAAPADNAAAPGTVQVSAERLQAIGVRIGTVERFAGTRTLRTTGRVAPGENATYPLVAGTSGWIRSVGKATTGARVRKHERLASFYSPEFAVVQQSWYSGLETFNRVASQQVVAFNDTRVLEGVKRFADTLRNMGVSELQLAAMGRERQLVQDIDLLSPVDGFVLERNASLGLRFDRGFELYRIADLQSVWVLADVYRDQHPFVRPGTMAKITTVNGSDRFQARVSDAEPVFDEGALTLQLRLEAENPGFVLKPGMFVDVELPVELPPTVVVPMEAIVDSGLRKTVYVERAAGQFEPRPVEIGWRVGDQVEVTGGLAAGERIVISGTFLIDSDSRLKGAAQGAAQGPAGTPVVDPVCGMQVEERRAAAASRTTEYGGRTYFFCADVCKARFEAEPGMFVK